MPWIQLWGFIAGTGVSLCRHPGEAIRSVRVALDLGMNFIDTSPFYGRGLSECLLGVALRGVPRDSYLLGTKLGRYDRAHFDFSPTAEW